jgi:hypothetical protein
MRYAVCARIILVSLFQLVWSITNEPNTLQITCHATARFDNHWRGSEMRH